MSLTALTGPVRRARSSAARASGRRLPTHLRPRLAGESTPLFTLIAAIVFTLLGFGMIMVLSASSARGLKFEGSAFYFVNRQLVAAFVGIGLLILGAVVPYQSWRNRSGQLLVVTVALLAFLKVPQNPVAISMNGATRWINLGVTQFQPSELAKFAMVAYGTKYLTDRRSRRTATGALDPRPIFLVFVGLAALIMLQPDLGTTMLLFVICLVMAYIANADKRMIAAATGVVLLGGVAISATTAFRRERFFAFLDPWAHPATSGYQTLQAQVGFAEGGFFGTGIGTAKAKYGYLPEAHTDFIFAILGEEFGLVGTLIVLSMYLVLTAAGFRVAMTAADRTGRLMAAGISTWLGAQALLNLGVSTGALPNKGITLPFMSYGGSSLIITLFATGVLLNIARHPGSGSSDELDDEFETRVPDRTRRRSSAERMAPSAGRSGSRRTVSTTRRDGSSAATTRRPTNPGAGSRAATRGPRR